MIERKRSTLNLLFCFLFPHVEDCLADPQLSTHIRDGGAATGLLERVGDLFVGVA
jgi:hypothetical protein